MGSSLPSLKAEVDFCVTSVLVMHRLVRQRRFFSGNMVEKEFGSIIPGVVYIYGEPYPYLRGVDAIAKKIKEIERLKEMKIGNSRKGDADMSLESELKLRSNVTAAKIGSGWERNSNYPRNNGVNRELGIIVMQPERGAVIATLTQNVGGYAAAKGPRPNM